MTQYNTNSQLKKSKSGRKNGSGNGSGNGKGTVV